MITKVSRTSWNPPWVRNRARSWTTLCTIRFLYSETAGALSPYPPRRRCRSNRVYTALGTGCGERPRFLRLLGPAVDPVQFDTVTEMAGLNPWLPPPS